MNLLFRPATGLMNRLKYWQKFLLLSLLFALPLGYGRAQFLREINTGRDIVERERAGTAYLCPLRQLLEHVPLHLHLAEQMLQRPTSEASARLRQMQAVINADLRVLAERDRTDGLRLDTRRDCLRLTTAWQSLKQDLPSLTLAQTETRHTQWLDAINGLISHVGDTSTLILDPDLDSYYTMNAVVVDLPACINLAAQARAFGETLSSRPTLTSAQQARFLVLSGSLKQSGDSVHHDGEVAAANNAAGNIKPHLTSLYARSDAARAALIALLTRDGGGAVPARDRAADLNVACDRVLQSHYRLWDRAVVELDALLANRAESFTGRQTRADNFALVSLSLATYLLIGFYRAVMATISRLAAAARQLADGDLSQSTPLEAESRDELAHVVESFNYVAAQLLCEWEMAQEETRRAEAAERKTRAIIENAVEGVFQTTPDGRYLEANPALARIYGYDSPQELIAELTAVDRQLYADPDRRAEFVALMEQNASISRFESEIVRRDGTRIWITETARAVRDAQGTLLYYEGTVRDVTERRQAQENVRVSNQRLQLVMNSVPQAIWWKDTNGVYLGGNANFARAAGLAHPEQLVGKTDFDLAWKPEEAEAYRADDFAVMRDNAPKYHIAESLTHTDGRQAWLDTSKMPMHDAQGRVVGTLGTFEDVTERREAERQILALNTRLEAANYELVHAYDATIEGWSRALDLRDKETEGHSQRVTKLTLELARAFGMADADLTHIRRGALLHDIGKLGVPDAILLKPDKLTDREWAIMRQHPVYAYEMLREVNFLRPALAIPYGHHEKWDGSGYPNRLRGEQIPLEARLFAIVDVWDALRSDRPYRSAWPVEKVLDHIAELAGTHFDPRVVETFLRLQRRETARPEYALPLAA